MKLTRSEVIGIKADYYKHSDYSSRIICKLCDQLLALMPEGEGARYRDPNKPNVFLKELDEAAELLQTVHPIGEVRAIGRLEVVAALKAVLAKSSPPTDPDRQDWIEDINMLLRTAEAPDYSSSIMPRMRALQAYLAHEPARPPLPEVDAPYSPAYLND